MQQLVPGLDRAGIYPVAADLDPLLAGDATARYDGISAGRLNYSGEMSCRNERPITVRRGGPVDDQGSYNNAVYPLCRYRPTMWCHFQPGPGQQ